MLWIVLATGPSMSQAVADSVRGRGKVIAVSDAYRLAPWADALASTDAAWWRHHKPEFAGRRFSAVNVEGVERLPTMPDGLNSGALAVAVARHLGATRIVLLGFDGHGTHYFGEHPEPLKNTTEQRRAIHMLQHDREAQACRRAGVQVWNCTPGTAIKSYLVASLEDVLCRAHG